MDDAQKNQLIQTTWLLWASQMDDPPPLVLVEKLVEQSASPFGFGGLWAVPHREAPHGTLGWFEGRPARERMHLVVLFDDKASELNGYTERAMRSFARETGDPGSEIKRWGEREAQLL